ncbi:MAG: hypothetical protein EAZ55_08315 [Cytophagales bacterium]|nr:MAG: hypothetical protein EAZ55_08315 [Cytophagales bacterium]
MIKPLHFLGGLLLCLVINFSTQAQRRQTSSDEVIKLTSQELFLSSGWVYHKGDNLEWAKPEFNDKKWKTINPQLWLDSLSTTDFEGIAWFRLHLTVDSSLWNKHLSLRLWQRGASEIYLNGKRIHQFGVVSPNSSEEKKYSPFGYPVSIEFEAQKEQVIAIRYSSSNAWQLYQRYGRFARTAGFKLSISPLNDTLSTFYTFTLNELFVNVIIFGALAALGLLHLIIFIFYPQQKGNFYYALYCLTLGVTFFLEYIHKQSHTIDRVIFINIVNFIFATTSILMVVRLLYTLFYNELPRQYWFIVALYSATILVGLNAFLTNIMAYLFYTVAILEVLRVTIVSIKKRKKGALTVGLGVMASILFIFWYSALLSLFSGWLVLPVIVNMLVRYVGILGISASMSIYLARDFAYTNKQLWQQLRKVQELSEKNVQQEKEKQEILAQQNTLLEKQVAERTDEILNQKIELEQQNEEILRQQEAIQQKNEEIEYAYQQIKESIEYARNIQKGILGSQSEITAQFKDAFIFFRPRDIVAGDFYWFAEIKDEEKDLHFKIIVAADCTGHGIPAAFMTVIGCDFLNEIVHNREIYQPDAILHQLDRLVNEALRNPENPQPIHDGMDIAIVKIDEKTNNLQYAGANNPLLYVRGGEMHQIKATPLPIGSSHLHKDKIFVMHQITTQPNDSFFIFSDGYQDQFGGEKDRKYMKSNFRQLLLEIAQKPANMQKEILKTTFDQWKQGKSQTDDVLVIGWKI